MKPCTRCKKLEQALKVIRTWADCDFLVREHVRDLCDKAMEETTPESERES